MFNIDMFLFKLPNESYAYTTSFYPINYNNISYIPYVIKRSGFDIAKDENSGELKITVPRDNPIALLYTNQSPAFQIEITLFQRSENLGQIITAWRGQIRTVSFVDGEAEITCEPKSAQFNLSKNRMSYEKTCNNVLYSVECGIDASHHSVDLLISSALNNTLEYKNDLANYEEYRGGYISHGNDKAMITKVTRTTPSLIVITFYLSKDISDIQSGDIVRFFKGCSRTLDNCKNRFNNVVNFKGIPYMPNQNPFSDGVY